nr:MAG TPA: hypothetical protein [Bacteriophage sp.]
MENGAGKREVHKMTIEEMCDYLSSHRIDINGNKVGEWSR